MKFTTLFTAGAVLAASADATNCFWGGELKNFLGGYAKIIDPNASITTDCNKSAENFGKTVENLSMAISKATWVQLISEVPAIFPNVLIEISNINVNC